MNLHYLVNELYYQRRRTLAAVVGLSIGIALLIVLNALSSAYRQAAHAPLKEIGADVTVQRSGNVPEQLTGVVFPCSAVTIRDDQVKKIEGLPGVRGVGKAVLLWVFDPNRPGSSWGSSRRIRSVQQCFPSGHRRALSERRPVRGPR